MQDDDKTSAIMELIGGYDQYVTSDELTVSAASEAPATTLPCASASSLWCFRTALYRC